MIDPATAAFDKYAPNQTDVNTTINFNDATSVTDVRKGEDSIGSENYGTAGNTLTIKKEYLAAQATGELALTVVFDNGDPAALTITISDTTPISAVIDPATAAFDRTRPIRRT